MNVVCSVIFDDEYKILKTKSRMMVKSLRTLKMPLFLLKYIKLNRNKVRYVWTVEFKKWLKELREVGD